jgi:exodeoxyribonuclease VII small subunit
MKKAQTFEASMARLEEIVEILENGGASLDETMSLYTEGAKLAAACSQKLEKAQQIIMNVGDKAEKKDE